jgi:hypothetical protein
VNGRRAPRVEGSAVRLAHAISSQAIPGLVKASFIGHRIRLWVPEADFTVRIGVTGPDGALPLRLEAVFREHGQERCAGGTWWDAWEVIAEPAGSSGSWSADQVGRLLADQIAGARRKFGRLLDAAQQQAA